MIKREDALAYHAHTRPGKIALKVNKPCFSPRDIRLAYLPGATFPCEAIGKDPSEVFSYTARGNLVGVVTNGTAVPGLGSVGPLASKPMQEGVAMLFKQLADIDVFDLELATTNPEVFVETVRTLEPTFGAINLKDLQAPDGLIIFERLKECLQIPVFHENLYSSAIVTVAAYINAMMLADKKNDNVRVVICGAGTVGCGCVRLLKRVGVGDEQILVYDKHGLIHPDRNDLFEYQRAFASKTAGRDLSSGVRGADVLIGASVGRLFTTEMLRSMNRYPVVLALAAPEPEIGYEEAQSTRHDVMVATSDGLHPNVLTDLLSFPYIFRGALDVRATQISESMMIAAAEALAALAREDVVEEVEQAYGQTRFSFGPDYLLPKPIDPRILVWESSAVAAAAIRENIATRQIDETTHRESLSVRLGAGSNILRPLMMRARQYPSRVVFSEGAHPTILRACSIMMDEGIASPILLGNERDIRDAMESIGLDLPGVSIVDPIHSSKRPAYIDEYFNRCRRQGVIRQVAGHRLQNPVYFAAMMVHAGDADLMFSGLSTHYVESLRAIIEVIGPAPGVRRIASHHLAVTGHDAVLMADCAINIDPSAEDLAEIAVLSANIARSLGLEPRIAMLSFSNFGSVQHKHTNKVRDAVQLALRNRADLQLDGEMQLLTARKEDVRRAYFPFCTLPGNANVLVFPDLQSGNLTMHTLQCMSEARVIGPILMGTRLPAHILQYGSTAEDVVHLTALGIVEAFSQP